MKTRRQLLTAIGAGAAAGIAGCSSDTENNTTRSETTTGTADTQEQTETPEKQNTETTEQEPDNEQTTDLAPVDAPFYTDSVRNANIQDFHSDTEELRNAAQQGGHTGAVQIGRLFQGQTDAESAYAAAQILHTDPDLATDYVIDTIPGQINASNREYIFIQPVQNGQPQKPVIAGQAYNGFEVYNPENPEQSSTSMQRLVDDGDAELAFAHQMGSIIKSKELIDDSDLYDDNREYFLQDWAASALGITAEDNVEIRPDTYEDGFLQAVSRGLISPEVPEELENQISDDITGQDIPYSVAGGLQHEIKNSPHYQDEDWESYEIQLGSTTQYDFHDTRIDDPL